VARTFPVSPKYPSRICWGGDEHCPADSLACGNGSERPQHPIELFGDDWHLWGSAVPRFPAEMTFHGRVFTQAAGGLPGTFDRPDDDGGSALPSAVVTTSVLPLRESRVGKPVEWAPGTDLQQATDR